MSSPSKIVITPKSIAAAQEKIPAKDFANKRYDNSQSGEKEPKGIFFLLSTPRSGSTAICDLLYRSNFCLTHEYFQPYEYLPLLAERWGCIFDGELNRKEYVRQLIKHRTSNSGWLGINLHASHLRLFAEFEQYLPNVPKVVFRIRRKNTIAQAISLDIARQTGQWSSEFKSHSDPIYCFDGIKEELDHLSHSDALIDAYISLNKDDVTEIYYEDFAANSRDVLKTILPESYHEAMVIESTLRKQASAINKEWYAKFTKEYFDTNGKGYSSKKAANPLTRFLRKLLP